MPPLARYKLNGDAADAGGNGYHGTPTDVSFVAGKVRQAGSFNGSTSSIQLPASNAILTASSSWTTMAWWRSTGPSGVAWAERVCTFHRGAAAGSAVAILPRVNTPPNLIISYAYHDGASFNHRYITGTKAFNTWYHAALTYDGTTFRFYHNGVLVDSVEDTFSGFGTYPAYLGHYYGVNAGDSLDGTLDDVRIYNEVLPSWKIKAIYNFGKGSEKIEPWQRLIRPTIQRAVQPLVGV
ncbi:MAG: LamG domain-containing protein [Pirellulales bacterium]|nr:LamG domain-containing protein [Pirellulales bacterium]